MKGLELGEGERCICRRIGGGGESVRGCCAAYGGGRG